MSKLKLSCEICSEYEHCEIIQNIKRIEDIIEQNKRLIKELKFIQLPITLDFKPSTSGKWVFRIPDEVKKKLKECKDEQQKCFNSRKHLIKYILEEILDEELNYETV